MNLYLAAQKLAHFVQSLDDFDILPLGKRGYGHMGATITDSILQAGLNYKTVVLPRVKEVLKAYPLATTTSSFLQVLSAHGANRVLRWSHPEKPRRVYELTEFFVNARVDTEECLANWLLDANNCEALLTVNGVGLKTLDYLKNFAGIAVVAVDRHITNFVLTAGIKCNGYQETQDIVCIAAELLNVVPSDLDHAIWSYVSAGRLKAQFIEAYRLRG